MVGTLPRLYEINNWLADTSVYQATLLTEFGKHIMNGISKSIYLTEGQAMPKASEHPFPIIEGTITYG